MAGGNRWASRVGSLDAGWRSRPSDEAPMWLLLVIVLAVVIPVLWAAGCLVVLTTFPEPYDPDGSSEEDE